VAVFVTHPETDEDVIYGEQRPALIVLQAVYEAVQQISLRWDRPLDVSFALDQVAADPKLSAQVDWNRVGVAGHSLGAYTALQLIGMQVAGLPAAHAELADARVKAVVALSPPGPGSLGLDEQSWDAITMPCMTIAGTLDVDPVTHSPTLRKMVFERSPGPDQYFVTLENATHGTFDDRSPWALDRLLHPQYAAYIADASTAFLNAYLRGDRAAQADLLDGSLERDSDGVCTVEFKNVTLIDGGD
jgi:predicted dienelactone hydrolase